MVLQPSVTNDDNNNSDSNDDMDPDSDNDLEIDFPSVATFPWSELLFYIFICYH